MKLDFSVYFIFQADIFYILLICEFRDTESDDIKVR